MEDTLNWEVPRAMGYDEKTAERVRWILAGRREVAEKKMVGGLSFPFVTVSCG